MRLSHKQMEFTKNLGKLLTYIYKQKGYGVTGGELMRTREQAAIYAKSGKGIVNSVHIKKLAIDLNLFIDGVYQKKTEAYKKLGKYWKSLDPNCSWGGDFSTRKDAVHFSMFEVKPPKKKLDSCCKTKKV